jgi:uncharacterized protein (DUF433 family)
MASAATYPHITIDSVGTAYIGKSRFKVLHLAAEHYHYGWSAEELLQQHPDLRPEEVYASLAYFYDHFDLLLQQIKRDAEQVDKFRQDSLRFSRTELLQQRMANPGS